MSFDFDTVFFEDYFGTKWAFPGERKTITWSTVDTVLNLPFGGGTVDAAASTAPYMQVYQTAFNLWDEALESIDFQHTNSGNAADITLAITDIDGTAGTLATWNMVWFFPIAVKATIRFDYGDIGVEDLLTLTLHEIGNVLGLGDIHPSLGLQSVQRDPYTENFNGTELWQADLDMIRFHYAEVWGTDGDDTLTGDDDGNVLVGEAGNDLLTGNGSNDLLYGAAGNDTLHGNDGEDELIGDTGADILFGGDGGDLLEGGASPDQLFGGAGTDTMDGGENSDVYYVDAFDRITDTGNIGYDKAQITDAAGVYLFSANLWTGVERINGFTGNDTINTTDKADAIVLSGDGGDDRLTGGRGNDIVLGGEGNDVLSGRDGHDTLLGGSGDDQFYGGSGNDVFFVGESGDEVIDAGPGFDKVVINNAAGVSIAVGSWNNVDRINGFTGNDTIDASGQGNALVIAASDGADVITGGNGDDSVYAGTGDDIVSGGMGNDALIGGAGSDRLEGGQGDDFLLGGAQSDSFVFGNNWSQDTVRDFQDGIDVLDFSQHAFVDALSDLTITQSGQHTRIFDTGSGDQVTLLQFTASDLDASDFLFV